MVFAWCRKNYILSSFHSPQAPHNTKKAQEARKNNSSRGIRWSQNTKSSINYFKVYFMSNPPVNDLGVEQSVVANDYQATARGCASPPDLINWSQCGDGRLQTDTPGCCIQPWFLLLFSVAGITQNFTARPVLLVLSRGEEKNQPWSSVEVTSSQCSSPGCPVRTSPLSALLFTCEALNCNNR